YPPRESLGHLLELMSLRECTERRQGRESHANGLIDYYPEEKCIMLTRAQATEKILAAKHAKGLTFEAMAAAVGRHKVWVTAVMLGQATMSADEANTAARVLGLDPEVAEALQEMPMKGSLGSTVPEGLAESKRWSAR